MTEKRKLAAILAADVVGFSRLTGSDEEAYAGTAADGLERSDRPYHQCP